MEPVMNCPECGAPDNDCETRYHECLVKEFTDPDYGSVHHLTVTAYMLQHSSKLTEEGWLFERNLLREFLIDHKSPSRIRKQNRDKLDSGKRVFKITSKDDLPKISRTRWKKTILDVRLEEADAYCSDVTAWALAVLEDAEEETLEA
jgi:hypothetical protein